MNTEIQELTVAVRDLQPAEKEAFHRYYGWHRRSPAAAQLLSAFGGYWGADRYYIGDKIAGILKAITLGGLGVWWLADLFLIRGAAEEKNIAAIRSIHGLLLQNRSQG